jgi:type I restriction enzyme, R subunit
MSQRAQYKRAAHGDIANRAHPQKHDTFVLDFMNDSETIRAAFEDYYRTTILRDETDPNKLHDLKADLDGYQVYAHA